MLPRLARIAFLPVVALAACQQTETPEQTHARMQMESDSARVVIEAKAAAFANAINQGDVDAIAALYAEDAVLMPPDAPAVTGRDAARATFAAMLEQLPGATMVFEVLEVVANGPLAVERGAWILTVPTPDGGSTEMRGKYLLEWHNVGGAWMIAKDIWNNDAPMAAM